MSKAPIDGAAEVDAAVVASGANPMGLATDGTNVYWTDFALSGAGGWSTRRSRLPLARSTPGGLPRTARMCTGRTRTLGR